MPLLSKPTGARPMARRVLQSVLLFITLTATLAACATQRNGFDRSNAAVPADSLMRAVQSVDRQRIAAVDIFDVYAGKGMEPGVKSVALSVRMQPLKTTFTDAEIDDISARIVSAVKSATGGRLRQ